MRGHRFTAGLVALLALIVTVGTIAPAHASPSLGPGVISGSGSEINKVTLSDTSIDAPSLWVSSTGTIRSVLAWTGTDGEHHLNVMTSSIGTRYYSKVVLAETSPWRPAVSRTSTGAVALAWTGMNVDHSLNVLYNVYGTQRKLTLWQDNSFTAPALLAAGDRLYLVWAGTDGNRSINIWPLSVPNLTPGAKITLPPQYNANATPSINFDPLRNEFVMSWIAREPLGRVYFATSKDAVSWSAPTVLPESSGSSPELIGIPAVDAARMPGHYLAWTGTDALHSLNVQSTDAYPAWPDPATTKSVLQEQAFGAPEIGFMGGPAQVLVGWTGVDAAHHLNVLVFTPTSVCNAARAPSPVSATPVYWGNRTRPEIALTFDAGGEDGVRATQILDILKARGIKATFFFEAAWAQDHPAIVQRVRAEGHDIGNHSVDHASLTTPVRTNEFVCYEITQADQIIAESAGRTTQPYFRPPFGDLGVSGTQVPQVAANLGYRTIMWTIDPRDWDPATTKEQILSRVLDSPNLQNGAIILLHAGGANTGAALNELITGIQSHNLTPVTMTQLLR